MAGLIDRGTKQSLTLTSSLLSVNIDGFASTVLATLTYFNQFDREIEGSFVYDNSGAEVTSLRATVGQRKLHLQQQNAKFPNVNGGESSTSIEDRLGNACAVDIGKILPKATVSLEVKVIEEIQTTNDGEALYFKTAKAFTPRKAYQNSMKIVSKTRNEVNNCSDPKQRCSAIFQPYLFDLNVRAAMPCLLAGCFSPSHAIRVDADAEARSAETVVITLAEEYKHDRPIEILFYPCQPLESYAAIEHGVWPSTQSKEHRCSAEDFSSNGVIAVSVMPELQDSRVFAEYVLMVDRSGSMSGSYIYNAKEALALFLKSLPTTAYFNIISFGSYSGSLFPNSQPYNQESVDKGCAYVNTMRADMGGSDLLQPLRGVLEQPRRCGYLRNVFILTDGDVSHPHAIMKYLSENSQKARIFAFGIGPNISHDIVSNMASAGQGIAYFASPENNIKTKLIKCLKESLKPTVCNIKVDWELPDSFLIHRASKQIPYVLHDRRVNLFASVSLSARARGRFGSPFKELQLSNSVKEFWFDEEFDSCQLGDNMLLESAGDDEESSWDWDSDICSQCSDYGPLVNEIEGVFGEAKAERDEIRKQEGRADDEMEDGGTIEEGKEGVVGNRLFNTNACTATAYKMSRGDNSEASIEVDGGINAENSVDSSTQGHRCHVNQEADSSSKIECCCWSQDNATRIRQLDNHQSNLDKYPDSVVEHREYEEISGKQVPFQLNDIDLESDRELKERVPPNRGSAFNSTTRDESCVKDEANKLESVSHGVQQENKFAYIVRRKNSCNSDTAISELYGQMIADKDVCQGIGDEIKRSCYDENARNKGAGKTEWLSSGSDEAPDEAKRMIRIDNEGEMDQKEYVYSATEDGNTESNTDSKTDSKTACKVHREGHMGEEADICPIEKESTTNGSPCSSGTVGDASKMRKSDMANKLIQQGKICPSLRAGNEISCGRDIVENATHEKDEHTPLLGEDVPELQHGDRDYDGEIASYTNTTFGNRSPEERKHPRSVIPGREQGIRKRQDSISVNTPFKTSTMITNEPTRDRTRTSDANFGTDEENIKCRVSKGDSAPYGDTMTSLKKTLCNTRDEFPVSVKQHMTCEDTSVTEVVKHGLSQNFPFSHSTSQPSLTDLYEIPHTHSHHSDFYAIPTNRYEVPSSKSLLGNRCSSLTSDENLPQQNKRYSNRNLPKRRSVTDESVTHMDSGSSSKEWGSVTLSGFHGPDVYSRKIAFRIKSSPWTEDRQDLHQLAAASFIRCMEDKLETAQRDEGLEREIVELSMKTQVPSRSTRQVMVDEEGHVISVTRELLYPEVMSYRESRPPLSHRRNLQCTKKTSSECAAPTILVSCPSMDEDSRPLTKRRHEQTTSTDCSSDEEGKYYYLERLAPEGCDQVTPRSDIIGRYNRKKLVECRNIPMKTIQRRKLLSARLTLLTKKIKNAQKLNVFAGPPFIRLILLQAAEGFWQLTYAFARILGLPLAQLELAAPFADCTMIPLGDQDDQLDVDCYYDSLALWATALALVNLNRKWESHKEEWELVANKADDWLKRQTFPQGFSYLDVMLAARQAIVLLEQKYRSRAKSEPVGLIK